MSLKIVCRKIKTKVCSTLARYPISHGWPTFWWRKCGYLIGKNTVICPYCLFWATHHTDYGDIVIEDNVHIGPNVVLVVRTHDKEEIANHGKLISVIKGSITIKNGSWIGAGAIILPNVIINEGAVVGAGAVVTKNVDSYTVVAGVPAKKIKDLNCQKIG